MSTQEARPMTAEEEAAYRETERAEEARQVARKRGRTAKSLSWSNDNSRMARITDPDGNEFLRLQFTVADEDRNGHAVFRQVECLIPAAFRTIG